MKFSLFVTMLFLPSLVLAEPTIYEKKYHGFTVWLDCQRHGAVAFYYEVGEDNGNVDRGSDDYPPDDDVPAMCQPTSGDSYRTNNVDPDTGTWDRGHLVPANHMDNSLPSFEDTFYRTNVLPQQTKFNQQGGGWRRTEDMIECYRDITTLSVWGGVIWGDDTSNDFFTETHGVDTADKWWKLILRHDTQDFIAWLFLNDKSELDDNLDDAIVSINELKAELNFIPDFGDIEELSDSKPETSWPFTGSSTLTCEGQSTSLG